MSVEWDVLFREGMLKAVDCLVGCSGKRRWIKELRVGCCEASWPDTQRLGDQYFGQDCNLCMSEVALVVSGWSHWMESSARCATGGCGWRSAGLLVVWLPPGLWRLSQMEEI